MAKDKRISELPGISAAAIVGLNRAGIVTVHDLLAAEFDRVAYVVDDYNEAARLVKEARKMSEGRRSAKQVVESLVPSPLSGAAAPAASRHSTRAAANAPTPSAAPPSRPAHTPSEGDDLLAGAMALAFRGVQLEGPAAAESRAVLTRRLEVAQLLLAHGGDEHEIAAAVLLEAAEAGAVSPDDVASRCGDEIERLIEECGSLRAVPMLPTGKPPRYYLEMARSASREARRICAAHLALAARVGAASFQGGEWYARVLVEALEAGGRDELVAVARAAVDGMKRAAA